MTQLTNPTIAIIGGSGKMGQWFQAFFEANKIPVLIYGRKTINSLEQVVQASDIVMISVPLSKTAKTIERVIPIVKKESLLTDISSLKEIPMQSMKKANCGTLGMHPLFGPTVLSPQGQKIVFCRQKDNPYVFFLQELFQKNGLEIIAMSASKHDKEMAVLQALPHALNILFAQTLNQHKSPLTGNLQTPVFYLQTLTMGRVLHQQPDLMRAIQQENPHVLPILKKFSLNTQRLLQINEQKNQRAFEALVTTTQKKIEQFIPFSVRQTTKIFQLLNDKSLPYKKVIAITSEKTAATIAYLGPEGTNTHNATEAVFSHPQTVLRAEETLKDVFTSIIEGQGDYGVVPAENSHEGTVRETLDLLADSPVQVVGSIDLPIHHHLLSHEKDVATITSIFSHPQALAQCKNWLKETIPNAKLIPTTSTTSGLGDPQPHSAHIASEKASVLYAVPIIAREIEEQKNNSTKFYVISLNNTEISTLQRSHTLLFLTIVNRVGVLRDILNIFASHNISLSKLESRPSLEKKWDYCFYLELDAAPESKNLQLSLRKLQMICTTIRILGRT